MLENATGNLQSLLYAAAAFTLATVYGAIPAAAVFFAGGFVSGLFHSEGIFAAFFTAVYALFAALPIYKVILDRRLPILANAFDIVAELPQSALRLPKKIAPTQVFLGVWAVSALVMAALANWAVTDVVGRDMLIFTGPFWAVNGALVTGFSLLWLGLTSALVAWDAAGEDVRVHEGFWHLYNNIITIDRSLGRKAQAPGQTARVRRTSGQKTYNSSLLLRNVSQISFHVWLQLSTTFSRTIASTASEKKER